MTTRDAIEWVVAMTVAIAVSAACFVALVGSYHRHYPGLGGSPALVSALVLADEAYVAGFSAVARHLGAALCSPDRPAACLWATTRR